jgi:hypothetical protein
MLNNPIGVLKCAIDITFLAKSANFWAFIFHIDVYHGSFFPKGENQLIHY